MRIAFSVRSNSQPGTTSCERERETMHTPIRTKSPLLVLYLWLFRNRHVSCMLKEPIFLLLGFVFYRTTYVLTVS